MEGRLTLRNLDLALRQQLDTASTRTRLDERA